MKYKSVFSAPQPILVQYFLVVAAAVEKAPRITDREIIQGLKVEKMRKVMLAYAEENKDWAAVLRNFGLL